MPEWSNGAVSKTVVLSRAPGVRIPLSPQHREQPAVERLWVVFFMAAMNACIHKRPGRKYPDYAKRDPGCSRC